MQSFVVADVHGFYDEMLLALKFAGYDKNNPNHCFVSLGDLLDRGPKPKECLDFVNSLPEKNKVLIRGNHEDLIEEMIHRRWFAFHDYHNGTVQTAYDITGIDRNDNDYTQENVCEILEINAPLNTYLKSCVDYFENNHVIFVHGWIPCDEMIYRHFKPCVEDWHEGDWRSARWINGFDAWHSGVVVPDKTIWCGHYHTSYGHCYYHQDGYEWDEAGKNRAKFTPFEDVGIVGMDACTVYSGFVNCKKIGKFKR